MTKLFFRYRKLQFAQAKASGSTTSYSYRRDTGIAEKTDGTVFKVEPLLLRVLGGDDSGSSTLRFGGAA